MPQKLESTRRIWGCNIQAGRGTCQSLNEICSTDDADKFAIIDRKQFDTNGQADAGASDSLIGLHCFQNIVRMVSHDRDMALIRIKGGGTIWQSLRQKAGQSSRHETILFTVPQEDVPERNFFNIEAPRLKVNQCFLQI